MIVEDLESQQSPHGDMIDTQPRLELISILLVDAPSGDSSVASGITNTPAWIFQQRNHNHSLC